MNSSVADEWASYESAYIALPLALLYWLPIFRDRHHDNKIPSFGVMKRSFIYLFLLGLCYLFMWAGIGLGLPSLWTDLLGQERTTQVSVVWKSNHGLKRDELHG